MRPDHGQSIAEDVGSSCRRKDIDSRIIGARFVTLFADATVPKGGPVRGVTIGVCAKTRKPIYPARNSQQAPLVCAPLQRGPCPLVSRDWRSCATPKARLPLRSPDRARGGNGRDGSQLIKAIFAEGYMDSGVSGAYTCKPTVRHRCALRVAGKAVTDQSVLSKSVVMASGEESVKR